MSNFRKDYDSASEVTAVLSILKEGHSASLKAEHLRYTILLWLVGKVLMPPYLPRIIKRVRAGSRSEILQRLNGLAVQYREKHADHILDAHDAIKVWERVAVVGEDIAKFIGPLGDCLEALAKSNMDIKNVII